MHLVGNRCRVDLQSVAGDTVEARCAGHLPRFYLFMIIFIYNFIVFSAEAGLIVMILVFFRVCLFMCARERAEWIMLQTVFRSCLFVSCFGGGLDVGFVCVLVLVVVLMEVWMLVLVVWMLVLVLVLIMVWMLVCVGLDVGLGFGPDVGLDSG